MRDIGLLSAYRSLGGADGTEPDDLLEHAQEIQHFDQAMWEVRHPVEANHEWQARMIPNPPAPVDPMRANDEFMQRLAPGYRPSGFRTMQRRRHSQLVADYLDDHFRRKWGLEGWVAGGL